MQKKKEKKQLLTWKDQLSILGALASIAGLIIVALNEPYRKPFVVFSLVALFFISLGVIVIRIVSAIIKFYEDLRIVLDARASDILSILHMKKQWVEVMNEQNKYRYKRTHLGVKYHSKDGKRVTFFKDQDIIAMRDDVDEIWDTDLRADGGIDWNTFKSSPGTPQLHRKKTVAAVSEIPTVFDKPLPKGQIFQREMSVEMADSFTGEIENLGLWIPLPTEAACISVEVPDDAEILAPRGFVMFGRYKKEVFPEPQRNKKNKVTWNIKSPQLGEKYVLIWRVR